MGLDARCYVEYRHSFTHGIWQSLGGSIDPGRDYDVFKRMAGVRGGTALVDPRGVPPDLGIEAFRDAWSLVCDNPSRFVYEVWHSVVSSQVAEKMVAEGRSVYCNSGPIGVGPWVLNDSFRAHSWLTCEEFAAAIDINGNWVFRAMLAAMRSLEIDGLSTRVIFWFF